jgi:predicted CoA-binding protein
MACKALRFMRLSGKGPRNLGARGASVNNGLRLKFRNPDREQMRAFFTSVKTVAVVGLSFDPDRPSYSVAMYLQSNGYRIVPVRPEPGVILGETIYPALSAIPFRVDAVDVFRRSEFAGAHVDEAISLGVKGVWLQEGVLDEPAAARARAAGLFTAMDICMLKEHRKL